MIIIQADQLVRTIRSTRRLLFPSKEDPINDVTGISRAYPFLFSSTLNLTSSASANPSDSQDDSPPQVVMKLVGRYIDKNRSVCLNSLKVLLVATESNYKGYITLRPEEDEDMWHLYNLIQEVSNQLHLNNMNPHKNIRAMKFVHPQSGNRS